jgi:hypothetical protein
MEVVNNFSNVSVARWTISDFFDHVNKKTVWLKSDKFALDGLNIEFYLGIVLYYHGSNKLNYYLKVSEMADEKQIDVEFKFWLENNNGKKCAETQGEFL